MSAAGSIILTLSLLLVALIGLPLAVYWAWHTVKAKQTAQRLESAAKQAQVYSMLQGGQQAPAPRRPRQQQQQGGPPIIIVGGAQQGQPWSDWRY